MKPPAFFTRFADWTLRHKRVAQPVFVLVFLSLLSVFVVYTVKIGRKMASTGRLFPCGSGGCDGCAAGAAPEPAVFPAIPAPPRLPKKR